VKALAALVGLVALLGAACGSDKSSQSNSTTDWANGLCSAVSDYRQSLTDAVDSLKDNVSQSGFQNAAKQVQKATDSFVKATQSLGAPNTDAGKQAKTTLDTLSSQLKSDLGAIKAAGGAGLVQGLSTVTSVLAMAQTQVKSAFNQLKGLDARGELSDAFTQASACASLR
jgi:hypothetical protein